MRRIEYYCNDCEKPFILECTNIMSETNHCMRCGSKNIKKMSTYEGPDSEISYITMERISDKCYNVEIDFGDGVTLQIGVDNTDGDIDATLLDRVMEALQRSYKLSFKDMYLVRCILKGLMRRVM